MFYAFFLSIYIPWRLGTPIQPSFFAMLHHITLFPIRANHPVSCLCSLVSILSHSSRLLPHSCRLFLINRLLLSTCHPHHCCIFSPALSPFLSFSMYVVVIHLRSLFLLALLPTCFISPFFLLCMKWVVCTTLYAELEKEDRKSVV